MTFSEFLKLDEEFSTKNSLLNIHRLEKRLHVPVKNKGSSVGRMMSAGTVKNPARPVGLISHNKPMTVPSVL